MSFYQEIVTAYDEIFPLNPKQLSCIENVYKNLAGKTMLDAGCGTGSLAIALGRRSATVKAFDLDEDMIERAREKCPQAINVQFKQGDLSRIGELYSNIVFDLIYCLGNTLVHLSGLEEIEHFVSSSRSLLKPEGKLLLQVVNYDRILSGNIDALPTIESDHYKFERFYNEVSSNSIVFATNLISKKDGGSRNQEVTLFPVVKEQLQQILSRYFSKIEFYSSFNSDEWTKDSFHTVVQASI